ncbi:MAG: universal stress protein [Chloroflexota bacterium]|nr:universal stress protein [Chloroflexota bacterium]
MTESRYKKILVPLDGSGFAQRAIAHAVDVARVSGAEIILLTIFTPPAYEYSGQLALAGQESQLEAAREEMKRYLIGCRTELRDENLKVRTHVIEGQAVAHLICDYVRAEGIDLIVMSSHGHSGIVKLLFGSVTRSVMECVDIPVLLIQPDKETTQ